MVSRVGFSGRAILIQIQIHSEIQKWFCSPPRFLGAGVLTPEIPLAVRRGTDLVLAFDFGCSSRYSTDNSLDVILHPCPRDVKTKSQQRPAIRPTDQEQASNFRQRVSKVMGERSECGRANPVGARFW